MRVSVVIYGAATLLAAVLAAAARRRFDAFFPSFFALPAPERVAPAFFGAVVLALIVVFGGRFLEGHAWYRRMAELLARMVRQLFGADAGMADFAIVACASSVGEEAFFRGFVQPALRLLAAKAGFEDPGSSTVVAVVAGAIVFASFHGLVGVKELRPWTLFALLVGLAWGALASWSGSLAPSIVSHFLSNFLNLKRLYDLELAPVAPSPPDG